MLMERIENGMSFLDETNPGWYYDINLLTLDMTSINDCVLGQLYCTYYNGVTSLDITTIDSVSYGFDVWGDEDDSELTAIWKDQIASRL